MILSFDIHRIRLFLIPAMLIASFASGQEMPRFSQEISVSIVNLYASVRNEDGRPVIGLGKEDFRLFQAGRRQEIEYFSADTSEPLNLAFLLDVSGSMRYSNKLNTAKSIVQRLISLLGPKDQVALIIFADGEAQLLIDFTTEKQRVLNRMEKLEAYGGTALRDAIAFCHRLLIENIGKKGVVLLSDGVDTRSDLTMEQATSLAGRVELPMYTFELVRSKWVEEGTEKVFDDLPLRAIAVATGGLYFSMDESAQPELEKAAFKIFEDLRYQYYLGYQPEGNASSGKIILKTTNPKYRVRVRSSVINGD